MKKWFIIGLIITIVVTPLIYFARFIVYVYYKLANIAWVAKSVSVIAKVLYFPFYLLGHLIWFISRVLLAIGYALRLEFRKAKDIIIHLF